MQPLHLQLHRSKSHRRSEASRSLVRTPSPGCASRATKGNQTMPKFVTIGYGDQARYDRILPAVRDAAHEQDAKLRSELALMGDCRQSGTIPQSRRGPSRNSLWFIHDVRLAYRRIRRDRGSGLGRGDLEKSRTFPALSITAWSRVWPLE